MVFSPIPTLCRRSKPFSVALTSDSWFSVQFRHSADVPGTLASRKRRIDPVVRSEIDNNNTDGTVSIKPFRLKQKTIIQAERKRRQPAQHVSPHTPSTFARTLCSSAGSIGLAIWPFIPVSLALRTSSPKALAVTAMIGIVDRPGSAMARIVSVAS